MKLSNKVVRDGLRIFHFFAAGVIALYVFSPLGDTAALEVLARAFLAALLASGLAM